MRQGLYIVATPIGNLKDITLRALEVLKTADAVVCEDTRVTNGLLSHYDIHKKLLVYNDNSDESDRAEILHMLEAGKTLALVSDAGTPLISDPGYKLVREVMERGIYVTTIPGASSVISALTISGLPTDRFLFIGFMPQKREAKRKEFIKYKTLDSSIVFFERGSRLGETLEVAYEIFGDVDVAIVREITKIYEEVRLNNVSNILSNLKGPGVDGEGLELRGEIVVILSNKPSEKTQISDSELNEKLTSLLYNNRIKDAANIAAEMFGISKKDAYERLLKLKNS